MTLTLLEQKRKVHSIAFQIKSFSTRIVVLHRQKPETHAETEKKPQGAVIPRDNAMLIFTPAIFFDAQKKFPFYLQFLFDLRIL